MSKLRRPKKAQRRLDIRLRDYEVSRANMVGTKWANGRTCPGSLKK